MTGFPRSPSMRVNADNEFGLDVSAVTGQATEGGGKATFTVALVATAFGGGDGVGDEPGSERGHGVAGVADLHGFDLEHGTDGDGDRGG